MRTRNGFSLIELLVVIAIIGVLAGLLMPAVQKVRESGNRAKCINNMKQLTLALTQYETKYKRFPAARMEPTPQKPNTPTMGTLIQFTPFLEQDPIFTKYNFGANWTAQLPEVVKHQPDLFICPSNLSPTIRAAQGLGVCDYTVVESILIDPQVPSGNSEGYLLKDYAQAGNDPRGLMSAFSYSRFEEVRDGISNTIAFVEDTARPVRYNDQKRNTGATPDPNSAWADSKHAIQFNGRVVDNNGVPQPCALNCDNSRNIYSFHGTGAVFGFADGSTRYLGYRAEPKIIAALITRAGGEQVTPDF